MSSVDPKLRSLNIDIPAQPEALVQLSLLLAEEDVNVQAIGHLIEGEAAVDMDIERNQFTDNAIRYEAAINAINGQIKSMMVAIQGN